jgi:hypothetical protein
VYEDIRLEQINEFSFIEPAPAGQANITMPKTLVLIRKVFKKETGGKLMVMKFMLWETNKVEFGYPAFVIHYTNFSSDRKDPLQRDIRVSDFFVQIERMFYDLMREHVKKGWVEVS